MIETSPKVSSDASLRSEEERLKVSNKKPVVVGAVCSILALVAIVLAIMAYQSHGAALDAKTQLLQANSQTAQMKTDLDRANALSADLQSQLKKAAIARADLQARLDNARTQDSALQGELTRARASLQAQQDQAKNQSSEMEASLSQASAESLHLRKDLDQARKETTDLKSQLAQAQAAGVKAQPLAQQARTLPVATSFEKGSWGGGYTMQVKNLDPNPLKVTVTVAGSEKVPAKSATLEGGGTLDVGKLASGAKVVVESAGYSPLNVSPW